MTSNKSDDFGAGFESFKTTTKAENDAQAIVEPLATKDCGGATHYKPTEKRVDIAVVRAKLKGAVKCRRELILRALEERQRLVDEERRRREAREPPLPKSAFVDAVFNLATQSIALTKAGNNVGTTMLAYTDLTIVVCIIFDPRHNKLSFRRIAALMSEQKQYICARFANDVLDKERKLVSPYTCLFGYKGVGLLFEAAKMPSVVWWPTSLVADDPVEKEPAFCALVRSQSPNDPNNLRDAVPLEMAVRAGLAKQAPEWTTLMNGVSKRPFCSTETFVIALQQRFRDSVRHDDDDDAGRCDLDLDGSHDLDLDGGHYHDGHRCGEDGLSEPVELPHREEIQVDSFLPGDDFDDFAQDDWFHQLVGISRDDEVARQPPTPPIDDAPIHAGMYLFRPCTDYERADSLEGEAAAGAYANEWSLVCSGHFTQQQHQHQHQQHLQVDVLPRRSSFDSGSF